MHFSKQFCLFLLLLNWRPSIELWNFYFQLSQRPREKTYFLKKLTNTIRLPRDSQKYVRKSKDNIITVTLNFQDLNNNYCANIT